MEEFKIKIVGSSSSIHGKVPPSVSHSTLERGKKLSYFLCS